MPAVLSPPLERNDPRVLRRVFTWAPASLRRNTNPEATASGGTGYLAAAELASMRAALLASLPDRCTIRRNSPTSDGQGGETEAWGDGVSYACRLVRRAVRETREGDRPAGEGRWLLLLPFDATVRAQDRVEIRGTEYEVVKSDVPASEPLAVEVPLRNLE